MGWSLSGGHGRMLYLEDLLVDPLLFLLLLLAHLLQLCPENQTRRKLYWQHWGIFNCTYIYKIYHVYVCAPLMITYLCLSTSVLSSSSCRLFMSSTWCLYSSSTYSTPDFQSVHCQGRQGMSYSALIYIIMVDDIHFRYTLYVLYMLVEYSFLFIQPLRSMFW